MSTGSVAIVTGGSAVTWDNDLPVIVDALRARGVAAEQVLWDQEPVAWDRFDLVVVRSTWDYTLRLDDFLAWADATDRVTRLLNPAPILRWNSDKRYLLDLARAGVSTVPTRIVEPGGAFVAEDLDGYDGVVVKPTVSAGSRDTARYEPGQRAEAVRHVRSLVDAGRAAMLQPYLSRVQEGERALVFVSGEFSHAILKGPVLTSSGAVGDWVPHPNAAAYRPTKAELETALSALAAVPPGRRPMLTRVDLVLADDGEPAVMELELIEPRLFLDVHPPAVDRVARAVIEAMP